MLARGAWGLESSFVNGGLPLCRGCVRYAAFMNRETPNYENIAKSVKTEMTDFVSYYR
jgi:hypothetical protein